MFIRTVWNVKIEEFQDLATPEFLRLSEGPRFTTIKVPWNKNQKFWHILDLDTGNEYYKTTTETRVLCDAISQMGFSKKMNSKSARSKPINNRYLINRVPRVLFLRRTGRNYDVRREYFYRY